MKDYHTKVFGDRMKYVIRDLREEFDRNEAMFYEPRYIRKARRKYVKWRLWNYGEF